MQSSTPIRFQDSSFTKQNLPLSQKDAHARQLQISNVRYDLKIAIPAGKEYFRGHFNAKFDLVENKDFFIDFQGREISHVQINGKDVGQADMEF